MSFQEYPNVIQYLSEITIEDEYNSSILSVENVHLSCNPLSFELQNISSPVQGICDFSIQCVSNEPYVAVLCINDLVIDVGKESFERFRFSTPFPLTWLGNKQLYVHFFNSQGAMDSSLFTITANVMKFNDSPLKRNNFRFPLLLPCESHYDLCYNKESGLVMTGYTLDNKKFYNSVVKCIT